MKSIQKQSGAVLIVGLIMVLVLSVVVIASSQTTILQQKMTSNLRDKELAFQSAETALRAGEHFLNNTTETALKAIVFDGSSAGYLNYNISRSLTKETDWQNLNTKESPHSGFQVKEKPVYIIENISGIKPLGGSLQAALPVDSLYYRVTAKAKGGTDASLAILQTVYKK